MRVSEIFAVAAVAAPLVAAHGDNIGMPKIFGLGEGVNARDFGLPARRAATGPAHVHKVNKRQGGVDGRCGPDGNGASCDPGYCCSSGVWVSSKKNGIH